MSQRTNEFLKINVSEKYYDIEKLINVLDRYDVIPNHIFNLCDRQYRGMYYHSDLLDSEKGYIPVDRSTFLRRCPFYFYINEEGISSYDVEPLEIGGLIRACRQEGYKINRMYKALEYLFYNEGISVKDIFTYYVDQVGEVSAKTFFMWVNYLEGAKNVGITEKMPKRLISSYNDVLEKNGEKPIIYEVASFTDDIYANMDETEFVFEGQFPCDNAGNPIFKWMNIRVKDAEYIKCTCEKSKEGKLIIGNAPKLLILMSIIDFPCTNKIWAEYYVGSYYIAFDYTVLKERRRQLHLTQTQVAEAVGTNERTYQRWESGKAEPGARFLLRLLTILAIDDIQSVVKYEGPCFLEEEIALWE